MMMTKSCDATGIIWKSVISMLLGITKNSMSWESQILEQNESCSQNSSADKDESVIRFIYLSWTVDSEVHVVHISHVIITYILE